MREANFVVRRVDKYKVFAVRDASLNEDVVRTVLLTKKECIKLATDMLEAAYLLLAGVDDAAQELVDATAGIIENNVATEDD